MRTRPALLTLAIAWLLGCRQPPAQLQLSEPEGAEPTAIGGPSVFVEAPRVAAPGPILDWTAVDDRFADLIDGERYRVDYDVDHPWAGSSAPLVTIVVFFDYQCPYCKRLDESFEQLLGQYGEQLRVVWRQFPLDFHREAKLASRYALAAHAQGLMGPMHEWLFEHAKGLSPEAIEQEAAQLGLDVMRLRVDANSEWIRARVEADLEFGKALGLSSTPNFFVNGRPIRGAVDIKEIEAMVDEEILAAERLIAAGSERHEVWARLLAASQPGPVAWSTPKRGPDPDKRYAMQLSALTPRGAKQPKVEILMCGDFDCPYSKKATATLNELRKRHKNELAIYFRHMPLAMHKNAMAAHRAAVAADNQGEFWAMFELLFADQALRSDTDLEAMAKQAGLKLSQFRSDLADPQTDAIIDQQREFCEKQLDARGTPTFYINGRPLTGAQAVDAFETIIAAELAASP